MVYLSTVDGARNATLATGGEEGGNCCSCGLRQELTKAIDEIARLRAEMFQEISTRQHQMVEMDAKVKDIPNIVSKYLGKDRSNVKRKVFNDEDKGGKSRNCTSSGKGDSTENGSWYDRKEHESVPRSSLNLVGKGVDDHWGTFLGKSKMCEVESSRGYSLNFIMKRKKGQGNPLPSLMNDREAYDKFLSSRGCVVGPFCLTVPFGEEEFKLAQFIFSDSLPDG